MSQTKRVMAGLVAGVVIGILLAWLDPVLANGVADVVQPFGKLWINALQMTVVPLVLALVIVGVNAASDAAHSGRVARRAMVIFLVLLTAAAAMTAVLAPLVLSQLQPDPAVAAALRGNEAELPATTGGWADAPGGPYAWGLYFKEEVGCEGGGCTGYCDPNNAQYPCAPGKTYHGRGPIQLSWNYNYGPAGEAIGEPLLAQPELVTSDGAIAFRTGLWFWMTAQAPKPSAHDVMAGVWQPSADDLAKGRAPGFGMTINIINGGLECGQPTHDKVKDRVGFYQRFTDMLAVDPGPALYCDAMQPY